MMRPPLPLVGLAFCLVLLAAAPTARATPFSTEEEELYDLGMDHQFDAAIALADRLIARDPARLIPHKVRVYCSVFDLSRDPQAGLAPYRERLRRNPGDPLARYLVLYGETLLSVRIPDGEKRKEEFERLRDEGRRLVEDHPGESEFQSNLARAHLLLLGHHEAGKAITEALRLDPDNVPLHMSGATLHMSSERQDWNRRWIETYIRDHPNTPFCAHLQLHLAEGIVNDAEKALRLEAILPSLLGTRSEDDARMALAELDRKADEHADAVIARGWSNQYVKAILRRADRLRDREGWAWFATEEVRQGNLRQAVELLKKSEAPFQAIPGALLVMRAKCHYLLEEYAEVRACLTRLAEQGAREARTHADHLYLAGDSWYAEGNHEEARQAYDRVLEGNAAFPIPSRLRHLECMVRQYPLLAVAQGSTLFLIFLSVLLSVALVAARLRHARRYFPLAMKLALGVTALELALFLRATPDSVAGGLMVAIVGFFKNTALLTAGMLLAARGGARPFALLRDLVKAGRGRAPAGFARQTTLALVAMFLCWAGLFAVTFGMMIRYQPRANDSVSVTKPLESREDRAQAEKIEVDYFALATLMVMAAAMEEILFRWFLLGFLQSYLRRFAWSTAWAVFLTAFLWGVGHMGAVDPWWFRLVQTTACGLLLGALRWKFGLESSFIVHTAYNWMQMYLGTRG